MRTSSYILVAATLVAATFLYWLNREPVSTTAAAQPTTVAEQIKKASLPPLTNVEQEIQQEAPAAPPLPADRSQELGLLGELPPTLPSPFPTLSPEYSTWAEERIDTLDDLSDAEDADSMLRLLSEIRNPDGNIRSIAMDSLMQIRNRDAIPYLAELAKATDDPAVSTEILETIEFLEIETLTERIARKRAEKEARLAEEQQN